MYILGHQQRDVGEWNKVLCMCVCVCVRVRVLVRVRVRVLLCLNECVGIRQLCGHLFCLVKQFFFPFGAHYWNFLCSAKSSSLVTSSKK
jgi:hypothetical protein